MRKILPCLFFIAFINLNAQTLTQSFNEPIIGDVDKSFRLDTSLFTSGLPMNVTGSNCVWNFNNLIRIFPLLIDSFITPAAAPGASAYPSASYTQRRDILYSYYKSTTSPQQTELLGAYSPSLTLTFTNSAIIASYPINYGYNLADPVSGSFKYGATNGACNGNITISADGVGTVNFPNNTSIPNVIRLKSVEILTLSIGVLPFGTFNQTIYNYYMPGKKFPILNISYTVYQLIAGTPTITAIINGSDAYFTLVGLNESSLNTQNYKAFPSPFHDELFINSEGIKEENEYLFYDMQARLVLKTKSLDVLKTEKLNSGVYFLEIRNKSGTFHQKVIKE